MDAPRNIHQAPADSPDVRALPPTTFPEDVISNALARYELLRDAARNLAKGRINRRGKWHSPSSDVEFFCMECRAIQQDDECRIHLGWCLTGRVLAALKALDDSDRIAPADGPGVDGYTPLHLAETIAGAEVGAR